MVYFDQMCVKYNLPMTNLTNMSEDLNLDQGNVYKSEYNFSDLAEID